MNDYQEDLHRRPPQPGDYERIDPDFGFHTFPLYLRRLPAGEHGQRQVRLIFGDDVGDWALTSEPLNAHEEEELVRLLRRARFTIRYNDGSEEVPFETTVAEQEPAPGDVTVEEGRQKG